MAYTFDAKTAAGNTTSTGLTVSHTCGGSADLIVVCLAIRGAPSSPAVTYAGASLTRAERGFDAADAEYAEIYYKVSPATGANNVVVSGLTGGLQHAVSVSSWIADNTPELDVTANDAEAVFPPNRDPATSVSGATGGLIIDCVLSEGNDVNPFTSAGGDQTVLHSNSTDYSGTASWGMAASYELSPASNETMNWTLFDNSATWSHAVAVFKETGGAAFMASPINSRLARKRVFVPSSYNLMAPQSVNPPQTRLTADDVPHFIFGRGAA